MLHDTIDIIFLWGTSLIGAFPKLVINLCGVPVGVLTLGFVVLRPPFHLDAAYCWALTMHSQKISCSVFRLGPLLWCERRRDDAIGYKGAWKLVWSTLPQPFHLQCVYRQRWTVNINELTSGKSHLLLHLDVVVLLVALLSGFFSLAGVLPQFGYTG